MSGPRTRRTPELLPVDLDELEKMEMGKTRPISKNNWYQWYDWDNNIPKSMKNPENNNKQKTMNLL